VDPRAGVDDMEKILTNRESNSDPSVDQEVDGRYTDYATPAHEKIESLIFHLKDVGHDTVD
jgi:hypothetical protein